MDLILAVADRYFLTPYIYPSTWREDDIVRQSISLYVIIVTGGYILYFLPATFLYFFMFDRKLMEHPLFSKDQISVQIKKSFWALLVMTLPSLPLFLLEVRGHTYLYGDNSETELGILGSITEVVTFIMFTDACIYWIHRFMHHKYIYKTIHKEHHRWKVPTPFASHAVHPLDGFLHMLPYHLYPFVFPLHKTTFLSLLVFVNIWTVIIHDGYFSLPGIFEVFVNGASHHSGHHMFTNYNYGQYFTLWDRIGGSYRVPTKFGGGDPFKQRGDMKKHNQNGPSWHAPVKKRCVKVG